MKTFNIKVEGRVASFLQREGAIICDNSDYSIRFTFDDEWSAHAKKTARFVWGGAYKDVEFTGDTCKVPAISGAHEVQVGVYVEETDLKTTTPAAIPCRGSILGQSNAGQPDVVQEYRDQAAASAASAEKAVEKASALYGRTEDAMLEAAASATEAEADASRAEAAAASAEAATSTATLEAEAAASSAAASSASAESAEAAAAKVEAAAGVVLVQESIVQTGTNIFNPALVVPGKTVDGSGNIVDTANGDFISQTFEVRTGESAITLSYVTGGGTHQAQSMVVTFFDSSMNKVYQASGSTHNIPSGAVYFIINIGNVFASVTARIMVQYGATMTEFETYYETVTGGGRTYVKTGCIEFVEVGESKNKYNYKTRTDNVSMNTDGTTMANTLRSVSDYIPCHGESVFSVGKGAEGVFCFYDENKNFLAPFGVYSSSGTSGIAIPSAAYYLRTSLSQTYNKTFTLAFCEKPIAYERYGKTTESIKSDLDRNSCKSVISEALANGWQIKLLGDSITHGVGGTGFAQDGETIPDPNTAFKVNTSGYCWANLFKQYIESKYASTVINFGTRGIRSYDILRRLEADNGYVTDADKLLVVMIGTNNKWATTADTLEDLKNDIQWLVDWCAENDKKVILVSAPMSSVASDTQYSDGSAVKFHNEDIDHVYGEVAHKNNMNYVPMYQRMVEYCDLKDIDIATIFDDGLHPNDKGYYIMYKLLMKELGLAYQMPGSGWDNASPTT